MLLDRGIPALSRNEKEGSLGEPSFELLAF